MVDHKYQQTGQDEKKSLLLSDQAETSLGDYVPCHGNRHRILNTPPLTGLIQP